MICVQIHQIPVLLEALLAALGVMGGFMTLTGGVRATVADWQGRPVAHLVEQLSLGAIDGFIPALLLAVATFSIVLSR